MQYKKTKQARWNLLYNSLNFNNLDSIKIKTPASIDDVVIDFQTLNYLSSVDKKNYVQASYLKQALESPLEVWLTQYTNNITRRVFISTIYNTNQSLFLIITENADSSLRYDLLPLSKIDDYRTGLLLYTNNN